jgi:hypothetical protein
MYTDECTDAKEGMCPLTKNNFHAKMSSTFSETGKRKYIKYGTCEIEGAIGED